MENIKFPVLFTTAFLLIYSILPVVGVGFSVMKILFVLSQVLVVWLVIRVLKDGKPSEKKFNEGDWYEDSDYKAKGE